MIVFDYMIGDMLSNKKLNPIVTELFIRGRKLNISIVSITKFYFCCSEKYQTKFYKLFHYENSEQKITSINRI